MNLQMVGCHHRATKLHVRERLAFNPRQAEEALVAWHDRYPQTEAVLLSTCNRVELYAAADIGAEFPAPQLLAQHLADFHRVSIEEVQGELVTLANVEVVRHLFRVAASLDSMVVGEPQIVAQVKEAYELAQRIGCSGPVTHQFFQAALRTARRTARETSLHHHRVSIPSVAIADFARRIFERFDDKRVLVLGAGEMAEETLRYLVDEGAREVHVMGRRGEQAAALAKRWNVQAVAWGTRYEELAAADLIVSATSAVEPVMSRADFVSRVSPLRHQRPLFILDLAIPRDFEPAIGDELGTYLYSIDDLTEACEQNRRRRSAELPAAEKIVEQEVRLFLGDLRHRITVPVISQLREELQKTQGAELARLYNKLPDLDERSRQEIERFADRLVSKILHPPLESLKNEAHSGSPHKLLEALQRLFQLKE
jgi:glutamyl-tRNA reductase